MAEKKNQTNFGVKKQTKEPKNWKKGTKWDKGVQTQIITSKLRHKCLKDLKYCLKSNVGVRNSMEMSENRQWHPKLDREVFKIGRECSEADRWVWEWMILMNFRWQHPAWYGSVRNCLDHQNSCSLKPFLIGFWNCLARTWH